MTTFASSSKSNRLLQSRRYTIAQFDTAEAYTNVLDLNAAEIYTQQASLPTSSLPFSGSPDIGGSTQNNGFILSGSDNIAQYKYRLELTPGNIATSGKYQTWFALSSSGHDPSVAVTMQVIQDNQQTSWISNKYLAPSLATKVAESAVEDNGGYNVVISKGANEATAVALSGNDYQFDYKTGVVQFVGTSQAPSTSEQLYISGYVYVGKTLADESFGGSGAGVGFPFSGSAVITGSLLISGSGTDRTLEIDGSISASAGITGSLFGTATTASYVENAQTASFVTTAQTASNIDAANVTGIFTSITSSGTISASGLIEAVGMTASLATFGSASIDYLTVNTVISGSTIITSGSNTLGDAMDDVQTLIGTTKITGSAQVTGSLGVSGSLQIQGIADVSASIAAAGGAAGIFTETGSFFATSNTLQITGSTLESTPIPSGNPVSTEAGARYALLTSQSAWHFNHNVGVPSSNPWGSTGLGGSYFENFNHNSDVSEILRFVAGLLSSSAPNAIPNTNLYTAINENISGDNSAATLNGIVPLSSTEANIIYLKSKGFAADGATLFNGVSLASSRKGQSSYSINYSNVSSGGTAISSSTSFPNGSGNTLLVGAGTVGSVVDVSGSNNYRFSDQADDTETTVSASSQIISQTGAGNNGGLTVGTITTANPAVIPNAFQDAVWQNVFPASIDVGSGLNIAGTNLSTKESTGYYELSASIAYQTGSGGYTPTQDATERILYTPLTDTSIANNSLSQTGNFQEALTAQSRSLSGAPYLTNATYRISGSVLGMFNPMYQASTTISRFVESDAQVTMSAAPNHAIVVSTNGGTIQTSDAVFPAGGGTARGTGVIPTQDDFIRLSGSLEFAAANEITNIQQGTSFSKTDFDVLTRARGRKPSAGETLLNTETINIHTAGTFNQPTDSGSLAYYGSLQDYDPGTLQGTSETFKGEKFRIQIIDSLLTGKYSTAGHFNTSSYSEYNLAKYDLQVKPGNLIFPGSSNYKYWLANPDTSTDYKYYARAFQTDGSVKTSLTLSPGVDLVDWNSSTDGVAIAIMFESAQQGTAIPSGGGAVLPRAKLYDFSKSSGGDPAVNQAPSDQLNPFSVNIDVGINFGGSKAGSGGSASYSMPLTDTLNMLLNSTYRNYILLVRYKGDPTPLTNIGVSY